MTFETITTILLILIGSALCWFGRLLFLMKKSVDAQQKIIESFKSQSDYIANLQNTLQNIYDVESIEKIISLDRKRMEKEIQGDLKKYERKVDELSKKKSDLESKLENKNKKLDKESVGLFNHNKLTIKFIIHIAVLRTFLSVQDMFNMYKKYYEKEFQETGPNPDKIENKMDRIEEELMFEISDFDFNTLSESNLASENGLHKKLKIDKSERLQKEIDHISDQFTPFLDDFLMN